MKTSFVCASRGKALVPSFWALLLAFGCGDPLKESQQIEEPRVLGVRVVAEGDTSTLIPNSTFLIDVLLADAAGALSANVAVLACTAKEGDRGVPQCSSTPFFESQITVDAFPLSVDAPADLNAGQSVAILGAVCSDSEPALSGSPLDWSCADGAAPLRLSFLAEVVDGDASNLNPDLSELTVESDAGFEIPLEAPDVAPTCAEDVPTVAARSTHVIRLDVSGALETGEELQLSHFSTQGRFERAYSFIDEPSEVALEWKAGEEPGPVKQYLVVRDGRGGVSWVSWTLCQN